MLLVERDEGLCLTDLAVEAIAYTLVIATSGDEIVIIKLWEKKK